LSDLSIFLAYLI